MGRISPSVDKIQNWKTGKILFKPKHIKPKDQLLTKYKKPKKHKKYTKGANLKPKITIKSATDNNKCLQSNRYLIFYHNFKLIKIDLKTIKKIYKDFYKNSDFNLYIHLCAIPNKKYFGIDYNNHLIFTVNENLKILDRKSIFCPVKPGTIIYLDGLIYLLGTIYFSPNVMETYDLTKGRFKKVATIKSHDSYRILGTFEGKILIGPSKIGNLKAYDPFSNSFSDILELESYCEITLLVANDKLYFIQSEGYVFESLPRDCTQWVCIGKNSIAKRICGLPLYSFYNDSIYFIGRFFNASLFEFNLKTRNITFVDNIY